MIVYKKGDFRQNGIFQERQDYMSNQTTNEKSVIRNIIIASQHLDYVLCSDR